MCKKMTFKLRSNHANATTCFLNRIYSFRLIRALNIWRSFKRLNSTSTSPLEANANLFTYLFPKHLPNLFFSQFESCSKFRTFHFIWLSVFCLPTIFFPLWVNCNLWPWYVGRFERRMICWSSSSGRILCILLILSHKDQMELKIQYPYQSYVTKTQIQRDEWKVPKLGQ